MALKSDQTTIDGIKIRTVQLRPRAGGKLQAKLLRLLAPALASFKGITAEKFDELMASDLSDFAPALSALASGLTDDLFDTLLRETFATTKAIAPGNGDGKTWTELNGDLETIDLTFEGNTMAMYQAMMFVWKVNFGDFSGGVFSKLRSGKQTAAVAEKTPTTESEST